MEDQEPTIRVRINQIDSVVHTAGGLDNTSFARAPVIRIYGDSSIGKKTCLYVHQVYPYIFVEYEGKLTPENVNRYITKLTHSLNHAIAISMKRNPNSPRSQFVRAIVLVKGVHFYGFHSAYSPFLKVHIIEPAFVNRAVTLLQSGTIMKTKFRVYESHLSFILQFLCDFGLYGCGWIDLADVWQRGQDAAEDEDEKNKQYPDFKPSTYYRQTMMPLELDVAAHDILNRHRLVSRDIHHELTIPAPPMPSDPVVLSVRELWEDERRRRIERGFSPSPVVPRDLSERSRGAGGDWVQEARWWDELRKKITKEKDAEPPAPRDKSWEPWVMTTFESVEALWESKYRSWRPRMNGMSETVEQDTNPYAADTDTSQESSQQRSDHVREVEVDEDMLASQELSRMVEREELEWSEQEEGPQENDRPDFEDESTDEDQSADLWSNEETALEHPNTPSKSIPVGSGPDHTTPGPPNPFRNIWTKLAGPNAPLPNIETSTSPLKLQLPEEDVSSPSSTPSSPSPLAATPPFVSEASEGPIEDPLENPFLDQYDSPPEHDTTASLEQRENVSMIFNYESSSIVERRASESSGSIIPAARRLEEDANDGCPDERPRKRPKFDRIPVPSVVASADPPFEYSLKDGDTASFAYRHAPPTKETLRSTTDLFNIPQKIYQAPYYSLDEDVPTRAREYAGIVFELKGGTGINNLEEWVSVTHEEVLEIPHPPNYKDVCGWEYAALPPGLREVRKWIIKNSDLRTEQRRRPSQIAGPTQVYGIDTSPLRIPTMREKGQMTALSLEVFAPSSGNGLPDPDKDPIAAVFYSFYDYSFQRIDHDSPFMCDSGIIVLEDAQINPSRLRNWHIESVDTELEMLNRVVDVVHELDPDIITGWEVQVSSWGYLAARARSFDFDLTEQLSRAPNSGRSSGGLPDQWGATRTSTFKVTGRHVFNLWRIMRSEHNLTSYTLENVVFQVLRRRIPRYSAQMLTQWYNSYVPEHASRLLAYYASRTSVCLELIEVTEVITKTSEFARVFGVDFFSVISRGSQFKVESFMFRIAKPESFVLLSPSKQDVGKQNAAECMPLIMEPLSAFYNSPLLVLDFQSLYPSIMIAYNYCYSTCLGRVTDFKGQNKFGVVDLHQPPGLLETLQDHINISPNGMIFVKPSVRQGLLGRMLTELLDTRVMIKTAMKSAKDDKALQRVLDARQLAMKFIANVTYGYTSASFSGRMPAVEIADAIVQSGRETLEKAIKVIDTTKRWGARVVYGDTDSLFIYLKGKTKDQAFRLGEEIADTITRMNPAPVKLKFEKVYLPCVLLAKKRYVGFKFETPDDTEPVFDAKGIETVRRDGVPAQQKMTETCLKILFRTQDLSRVKAYCCSTWEQILDNRASIQDFIFAKEVRLGTYSDQAPPPPGVAVAARRMLEDPNDEPQYGDRIPYIIARGPPGTRLVDRAVAPAVLLQDSTKHVDGFYYISRVLIPPLERIFNLVGADVRSWYDEMSKPLRADEAEALTMTPRKIQHLLRLADKVKIEEHFYGSRCLTCDSPAMDSVCDACHLMPQETISGLLARIHRVESRMKDTHTICVSCSGTAPSEPIQCESLDCPWLYERKKLENKMEQLDQLHSLLEGIILDDDADDDEDDVGDSSG